MKKTILLFLLVTTTFFVKSQNNSFKKYEISIDFFSPQLSWLSSDIKQVEGDGARFGYNFGINIDKYFTKNYALRTGLKINNMNAKLKFKEPVRFSGVNQDFNKASLDLQYLEIPIGLKLRSNEVYRFKYFALAGFNLMFNTKAKDADDNNFNDAINTFNFGYHFGGGAEIMLLGRASICMALVYNVGIVDVIGEMKNLNNVEYSDKTTLNNIALNLSILF